jgi:ligand-binding SRPBCC domain-containing protein
MEQKFEVSQWVPFRVELVFAFFANPSDLPLLMPPKLGTRVEEMNLEAPPPRPRVSDVVRRMPAIAAGAGSEILISYRPFSWLTRRTHWRICVTEFLWNSYFCDEQVEGPFKMYHHRHTTKPEVRRGVEGTLVTDTVDYELPFGPLRFFGNSVVRRKLEESFEHRQKRLPEIMTAVVRLAEQCG